jgi:CysZ protein
MDTFLRSISYYFEAIQMASKFKLWRYLWIPGLISILTAFILVFLIFKFAAPLGDLLVAWYKADFAREWFMLAARISAVIVLTGTGLVLFRYIVLILSFPFMSLVSQKLEYGLYGDIAGQVGAYPALTFVNELIRGAVISGILISRELGLLIILYILTLIPGMALITTPIIFIVQAYHAGCANLDYTLERYFSVKDALNFMRLEKGMAFGNGAVFLILLGIPVVGIFIAPIMGTISGALISLDRIKNQI